MRVRDGIQELEKTEGNGQELLYYYFLSSQVMSGLVAAAALLSLHATGVSANRAINEIPLTAKDWEKRDYRYGWCFKLKVLTSMRVVMPCLHPKCFQLQLWRQFRIQWRPRLRPPRDARRRDDERLLLRALARRPEAEGRVHRRREGRVQGAGKSKKLFYGFFKDFFKNYLNFLTNFYS